MLRWILALVAFVVLIPGCGSDSLDISDLGPDEVAVSSIYPLTETLSQNQHIRITFNQDLAPPDADLNTYLESPPATLTPAVAGTWKWSKRSTLEFIPQESYLPATAYKLVLDPEIAKAAELKYRGKRAFAFTADPLKVVEARLFSEPVPGVKRTYRIKGTFSFNLPVAADEFAGHFELKLERRGDVEFEIETEGVADDISFRTGPIVADEKDEEIRATVSAGLRPPVGRGGMAKDESRTAVIPSFRRLAIHQLQTAADREQIYLSVQFSSEVAPKELMNRLTIDPVVPGLRLEGRGTEIRLHGTWEFARRYTVRIDRDLIAEDGLQLERNFERTVLVQDLPPLVEIAGAGNYLTVKGDRRIGIETINIEELNLTLDKVYHNNLVPFLQRQSLHASRLQLREQGTNLYRRDLDVSSPDKNSVVLTPVDLGDVLREDSKGIFRLTARKADELRISSSRLIVATDLGIVAKRSDSELVVAVVSIAGLKPLAGVRVEVLSYNNQVLSGKQTDAQGFAVFRDIEPENPITDGGAKPFVITARQGDDLGFLAFKDTRIPTGDFDIGGIHQSPKGYQAFVYSDRGIYRPGDRARLCWITRDNQLRATPGFPLTVKVIGPDGRVFREAKASTGAEGMAEYTLDIPEWAPTGSYSIHLQLDPTTAIGSHSIRVEDFMPDRMKVDLSLLVQGEEKKMARPGDKLEFKVEATTLFGPPAAGREAKALVRLVPAGVYLPAWPKYTFGDQEEKVGTREIPLGSKSTDQQGLVSWGLELPATEAYHGWLRAEAEVEVTELGGGRAIGGRRSVLVSPVSHLIGLRRDTAPGDDGRSSDYGEPGEPIPFQVILVDLDGQAISTSTAVATVFRRKWRTVLRKDRQGRYRYMSEYDEETVETRDLKLAAAENRVDFTVDRHGSYRLLVEDPENGARSSILFYVYGWGYAPWAMSAPEKITIRLDREEYAVGDVLKAEIEAPFPGLMLLTVERDEVFLKRWVRLDSNSAVVEIPVDRNVQPNAYVVATLLRPLDSVEVHAPARAFGAAPLVLSREPARLAVEVQAPEVMRPRRSLSVRYRVPNASGKTTITLAAVDEGILQITGFATPSPLDFYFQRRRLSVESFDVWSLLLPEYERVLAGSKPGGDAAVLRKNLSPISVRRVKPVALWSGVMEASRDWRTFEFDVPEFNGALRIMAVAAGGEKFGNTEHLLRVRDPIVLSPNLPRFLAPGDKIEIPVQVYNGLTEDSGDTVSIQVSANLAGPVAMAPGNALQESRVAGGKERVVVFEAEAADSVGKATFTFVGQGRGRDERVQVSTDLPVRPPRPLEARVQGGTVRDGQPATGTLATDLYPETARIQIAVSPLPVSQVAAGLAYLLRYPYGCIEQTVSQCFPLLYFSEVAGEVAPDVFGEADAVYFVNSGIDRVVAMQLSGGGFSYWPGGTAADANPWATVYATHFLVEARRAGFVVPDRAMDAAVSHLGALTRSSRDPALNRWNAAQKLRVRAYGAYVLALAGLPEKGAMEKMRLDDLERMPVDARYQLAGAYGLTGNKDVMRELLPVSVTQGPAKRQTGYTWHSRTRADAIMLEALATAEPGHSHVPVLLKQLLDRSQNGRWHNTQENGWAFLALGKVLASMGGSDIAGEVLVGGEIVGRFDAAGTVVEGSAEWAGKPVEIRAEGSGFAYYSIIDEGVPRGTEVRDVTDGLLVKRDFFTLDGAAIDLENIRQGEVVVARIELTSRSGRVQNIVVADLVPAGLEIENPRLMTRGAPGWARSGKPLSIEYLDVRDDRLLLFTWADTQTRAFVYTLRAVTRGRFVLPPVKAEAMYDPSVVSIRGGGTLRVVAAQ